MKIFLALCFIILVSQLGYTQCSTGCTYTANSSNSTNYTVNSGEKLCVVANSGNITLSGAISLKKNGAIVICTASNDTVTFSGTWGEPSPGGGDRTVTIYGNVNMNQFDASIGWRPFRSKITNYGYIAVKNSIEVYDSLTNYGTIKIGGGMSLMSGSNFTNKIGATVTAAGNYSANSSSIFSNYGTWNIGGDAAFNGTYNNSGVYNVGGTLSINAAGTVNISGGRFYSTNLTLNSAVVNAGSSCAAFIVTGNTAIQSSTFKVGTGVVDITDLSDPGTVNVNNCPAGPPANCGLSFSGSIGSNSCLSTLPVSLVSFNGKFINESQAELFWATESEEENMVFILERTEDLKTFTPVATIQGRNKNKEHTSYSYIDNFNWTGDVYYRLRQKDQDGSLYVLGIILPDRPTGEFTVTIFPNPSKGQFKITCQGKHEVRSIQLLDHSGQVVYSISDLKGKEKIYSINLDGLKGMYVLAIATDEEMIYDKVSFE